MAGKSEAIKFHRRIIGLTEKAQYGLLALGAFSAFAGLWSEIRLNAGGEPWIFPHSPRFDASATIPFHVISHITTSPVVSRFSHWSLIPLDKITPQDLHMSAWVSAESGADAATALLSYAGIRVGEKIIREEKRKIEKLTVSF